jgi:two-component system, NarL family, response regulator LiaR
MIEGINMAKAKPIRVLIVDDHAMVRSGLKNFISAYEWMEVAGEAADGAEAVEFCSGNNVDIVLMDMMMPGMDGSEATRRIMALGKPVRIIVLTSFHEQDSVEQALKAGATSYLLKNVTAEELAQAIRATEAGRSTLSPEATEALIASTRNKTGPGFDLTGREKEVLALLVKSHSNSEIAAQLSISMATTKYHLMNIFTKLGAKSRVEAVTKALEYKLVEKV